MKYRKLGRTGIEVSEICLGTMTWGNQNSEKEGHEQLDYAVGEGINFIDTAEAYSVPPSPETYGATERIIGNWLAKRGKRDDLVIASKVCGRAEEMHWPRPDGKGTDLAAEQIKYAVEGSLKRLQTDYIDLYQLHWPSRTVPIFGRARFFPLDAPVPVDGVPILESLEALGELVKTGKVRHIGLSNESPWGTMEFLRLAEEHGLPRAVSVQNPYNFLNRSYEFAMAEVSLREEIGLLAYSPLASGMLTGKYAGGARPEGARLTLFSERFGKRYLKADNEACVDAHLELAREHGLDPAQMAIAYTLLGNFVTSSIIGATKMEQLRTNIAAASVELTGEVVAGIQEIGERFRSPAC